MKCFLHPDLKLDRLVIVGKFDGISSQRWGSEINMELKKEEVLEDLVQNLFIMSFQKFITMTKNTPFLPILHVFAHLNDVRVYIAWSWKTTLITWIFLRGWYPTSNTNDPFWGYNKRTSCLESIINIDTKCLVIHSTLPLGSWLHIYPNP